MVQYLLTAFRSGHPIELYVLVIALQDRALLSKNLGGSLLKPHPQSVCGLRCLLSVGCPHRGSFSFTLERPSHLNTRDAPEFIYFWDLNAMQLQNDSGWL